MFQILMIDDTKSVHAFVKSLLAKSPEVVVTSVFNGAEALKLLETKKDFDVIFLDWEMPVLDGPSTFASFIEKGITIPTLMMTTKNKPEEIEKMLMMGVSEYLMKPFTIDILFEKIEYASGKALKYAA